MRKPLSPVDGLLALSLLCLSAGCVAITDAFPYRLLDDDDSGDDDDVVDDDDSGDDDSAGDDDDATPCDTSWLEEVPNVSLAFQLEPIFLATCDPCHTVQDRGDLQFVAAGVRDVLVDVPNILGYGGDLPRVTPGDPEASYILHKLVRCGPADPTWGYFQSEMPPPIGEVQPMTDAEVGLLYSWILQGAEDN